MGVLQLQDVTIMQWERKVDGGGLGDVVMWNLMM